jgi:cytochrome bd-type quinol oxidase subunit 2
MRGLITKDLMFFRTSWKNLLITFIGTFLLSIALGNYTLAVVVVPIYIMSSGINTFQTDEFYNTMAYTLSFPLSRKKIVLSKYLFTLIMMLISILVGIVIYLLILFIINPGENGLNVNMIFSLLILECASLIVDSIFYPVIYKYGCEKSRLVLMSIVMLLLGIGSIISVSVNVFELFKIDWESIIGFIQTHGVSILSILTVVMFTSSYFLSYKFYKKKDY